MPGARDARFDLAAAISPPAPTVDGASGAVRGPAFATGVAGEGRLAGGAGGARLSQATNQGTTTSGAKR
jgi:hypothetical protein